MRVFYANAETFVDLYKQLQSLVPEGRPETPVRLQRTARVSSAVETTLQETLGAEAQVLVIVDPGELPRGFHSVDLLAEQIGDAAYRGDVASAQVDIGARSPMDTGPSGQLLSDTWGRDMQAAAEQLRTRTTLGDPHLDAKLFPSFLPHGTGSCRAEAGS